MLPQTQQNRKDKLIAQMDQQLSKSGLIRRCFPEGSRSLFKAVSDWLYYTPKYSEELITLCQNQLKRRVQNNNLTSKLNQQFENRALIKDYYQNPDLNGFTKVHLGLISLTYDRKIIIYHMHQNYLSTITVNNSSNKHAPIILCRVHNSYAAVLSKQVNDISQMVRARICEKLMSHSFSISNPKTNEEKRSKLFETPTKRVHKKSLSLCDELQYQGIFNTPSNFAFPNLINSSKFISMESNHQDDDLALIGMCNMEYVHYPAEKPATYFGFSPQINRAESMRIISMNGSARKDNLEYNGTSRHKGRLKFFDQNKNYGFIVMDEDNSDIFVHYDDLSKAGMTKQYMRSTKHGHLIMFQFSCMSYIGKYDKSRKAVDLTQINPTEFHY